MDCTKTTHSCELFLSTLYRSLLIFVFLCPPSEDETSELCLGLQTLLELKVSLVCDVSVLYRSPVSAAYFICKDASQDWRNGKKYEKKKEKSSISQGPSRYSESKSGKRLHRFILVAQYVSDSYCEGKSKIRMKRGDCGGWEFEFSQLKIQFKSHKGALWWLYLLSGSFRM